MKTKTEVDLYSLLGLTAKASLAEIKEAHRRLSKQYHPDTGGEAANMERFSEVQRAWRTLSDPQVRATYDATGDELGSSIVDEVQNGAIAIIGSLIQQLMGHPDIMAKHLPNELLKELKNIQRQHVDGRGECEVQIANARRVLKKLKFKAKDRTDIISGVLEARITLLTMSMEKSTKDQLVVDRAISMIDGGYDYTPDKLDAQMYSKRPPSLWGGGSTFGF